MRAIVQLIGGVAVAGAVAAGSTALTATGLATAGTAAAPQFVGGTVTQTVTGATLDSVAYGFVNGTNTAVNLITLTFADATGSRVPTVAATGGTWSASGTGFTCNAINGSFVSTCSPTVASSALTGITSLAVTVPN